MAGVISFLCSIKYLNVRIISKVVKIRLGLDKLYEWYLWTFNYSIKGSKKLEPKLCFTYQRLLKFKTSLHFLKNGGTTWSMYYCLWRGSTDNFKLNRNYDRIVFYCNNYNSAPIWRIFMRYCDIVKEISKKGFPFIMLSRYIQGH